jgi:hypothetical protein
MPDMSDMTEMGEDPLQDGPERPGSRRSELERLIDRTVLGPTHPELGTCWQFTGTTTPYGRIAKAQDSYTHRLGWKLLEPVTQSHLRKTHCKRGHLLSGDNLRIGPNGVRVCKACNAAAQRAFRERHRAPGSPSGDSP